MALSANFKEDILYSYVPISEEQLTIIEVLNFPDKESLSSLVSLESLKGIWSVFLRVTKALITFPKQDNE